MVPKRHRGSTSQQFDDKKFVSFAASEKYREMHDRSIVQERGLSVTLTGDREIASVIAT